jgi:hypothetical protein
MHVTGALSQYATTSIWIMHRQVKSYWVTPWTWIHWGYAHRAWVVKEDRCQSVLSRPNVVSNFTFDRVRFNSKIPVVPKAAAYFVDRGCGNMRSFSPSITGNPVGDCILGDMWCFLPTYSLFFDKEPTAYSLCYQLSVTVKVSLHIWFTKVFD